MRKTKAREATAVDALIGADIRKLRILRGVTQEKLAESLDITFQQVQKYEQGSNRISMSRYVDICRALDVPYDYFLRGIDGDKYRGAEEPAPLDSKVLRAAKALQDLPEGLRDKAISTIKAASAAVNEKPARYAA